MAFPGKSRAPTIGELSRSYPHLRSGELRWGGFKSVRYSVGLFTPKFSDRRMTALKGDPYDLTGGYLEGVDRTDQRRYLKSLVLTAIIAANDRAAYQAFRDGYPAKDRARGFKNADLARLLDAFLERTPHLLGKLFNDQGIRLMNVDARIAEGVLNSAVAENLAVLYVHDSFIVDYRRVKTLKDLMARESERVVGRPLPIDNDWMGWDEVPEERREDYAEARRLEPTRGSLERRAMFEAGKGRIDED